MDEGTIGLPGAVAIGVGGMVGGGIFAVLGVVAVSARGAAPLAFAVAGAVALLTAYAYARLSVAYPSRGGTVVFLDRAFAVGLATGSLNNLLWAAYLVTLSLYALAFAHYAATFLSANAPSRLTLHVLISAAILVPALLNLLSAAIVARTETAVVVVKLALLAVVGVAGATAVSGARVAPSTWPPLPAVVAAGMLIFVAYEGFELIANAAEDVRRPRVTLPRAYFGAVGLVLVLYVVIAVITVGSLSPAAIAGSADFALAEAAKPSLGEAGFRVVAAAAVLATFSAINATLYGAARLSYSIAAEGELPPALERRVWSEPVGLLLTTSGALVLANALDLRAISSVASASFLVIFAAVNAAAFRRAGAIGASRAIAAAGVAGCLAAVAALLVRTAQTTPRALAVFAGLTAASVLVEALWLRRRRGECRPSAAPAPASEGPRRVGT